MADAAINGSGEPGNAAQIAYWNDRAGAVWTRFQERLDALFAPITTLAVAVAAPQAGEHVIDVGCGCGETVLQLAERVSPGGDVLGLDVSAPMAARARQRIADAGVSNAHIVVGDAAVMPLQSGSADLLFSRFGVMFFDQPVAAFAHLRTGMRPDGRLLFAVWRALADNDWFGVPLAAAAAQLPPQPPADPFAPGPFAFADRDHTHNLLTEAGWHQVKLERHDVKLRIAPPGALEEATEFALAVGPLARALVELGDQQRDTVRDLVRSALRQFDSPDGFLLKGSVWLVSAKA